jgi:hypothetical protein
MRRSPGKGRGTLGNPLRSEAAAFRWLLLALAIFLVAVAIVAIVRAA